MKILVERKKKWQKWSYAMLSLRSEQNWCAPSEYANWNVRRALTSHHRNDLQVSAKEIYINRKCCGKNISFRHMLCFAISRSNYWASTGEIREKPNTFTTDGNTPYSRHICAAAATSRACHLPPLCVLLLLLLLLLLPISFRCSLKSCFKCHLLFSSL